MKNFLSILLIYTFFTSAGAMAACFTGAACSIDELEHSLNQKNIDLIKSINKYFDR